MKQFFKDVNPIATIVSIIVVALLVGCFFSEIARTIVLFGVIGVVILSIGAFAYICVEYICDTLF